MDLFFEKNRFRICDFGSKVEIYKTKEDELFPGYKNMIHSKNANTDFNKYGLHNCNLINDILNNNEVNNSKLICERDINNIINKVKNESNGSARNTLGVNPKFIITVLLP